MKKKEFLEQERQKNFQNFLQKSKIIHQNWYDYSLVQYVDNSTEVSIICPLHGIFKQTPMVHVRGSGCSECAGNKKHTLSELKKKFTKIHQGKNYSYKLFIIYENNKQIIQIICPKHGPFPQRIDHHLNGIGCPKCRGFYKTTEEYIEQAHEIHHHRYDYSLTEYHQAKDKIIIICTEHGPFTQLSYNHLHRQGCPQCDQSIGERKIISIFTQLKIPFEMEYIFPDCRYKRVLPFDFYLPNYNLCIEFDGIQHFESVKYLGGDTRFEEQKIKDEIKNQYCKNQGIKLLRIPYYEINLEEIIYHKLKIQKK